MRRPLLLVASIALLAALLAGSFWLRHHRASSRRLAAWQEQQKESATRDLLERLITLEGGKISLPDFAALISKHSGLPVDLDEPSISAVNNGVAPSALQLRLPKGALTIHSALRLPMPWLGLWADVKGDRIVITSAGDKSADLSQLTTAVYPLPPTVPSGLDEEACRQIVLGNLGSPWRPASLRPHVETVPGALIVVDTPYAHRRIRQVMDALASLDNSPPSQLPLPIPPPPPGTMEQQINAALDSPTDLAWSESPLQDVIAYIAEMHNVPLIIDVKKLTEVGVSLQAPINKWCKDICLRSALRLILNDLELTYVVRDETVLITTPEDAESQLRAIAYPVKDLLGDDADINRLIEVVTTALAPQSWNEVGGPGLIRGVSSDWLLVSQTNDVHEQVVFFLDRLRRMLSGSDHPLVMHSTAADETDEKIRQALNQEIELDFVSMPLRDVIAFLQEKLQIPIVLAAKKLEEASVSPDTPITANIPNALVKSQLRALLDPLELTYVIRDEVLIITTPEDAESQILTRFYDVRSLLSAEFSGEQLCEQLRKDVNPPSWDRRGGPATVSVFRGILIVGQTHPIHEDIENWLADVRAKRANESPTPANR